jgi:hypothetical protein
LPFSSPSFVSEAVSLSGRSVERHRAEIREHLGFREATVADGEALAEWLQQQTAAIGANADQLTELLEGRCRTLFVEPPSSHRVDRIVRTAIHAHDERLQTEITQRLRTCLRSFEQQSQESQSNHLKA